MNNINKLNFGFWYTPEEEDYIVPSWEEILLQWIEQLGELESIDELEELEEVYD